MNPTPRAPIVVSSVEAALDLEKGGRLGTSAWVEVTQGQIDKFAEATGDCQWIHVDPDRAKNGPFGTTVAHGYLTLSLVPRVLPDVLDTSGFAMGINYGCNRVRFPAPVPAGSRLRAVVVLDEVSVVAGGVELVLTLSFEIEGRSKPACVATIIVRMYE